MMRKRGWEEHWGNVACHSGLFCVTLYERRGTTTTTTWRRCNWFSMKMTHSGGAGRNICRQSAGSAPTSKQVKADLERSDAPAGLPVTLWPRATSLCAYTYTSRLASRGCCCIMGRRIDAAICWQFKASKPVPPVTTRWHFSSYYFYPKLQLLC